MRLVTYLEPEGVQPHVGVVEGNEVIGLALPHHDSEAVSMRHVIETWDDLVDATPPNRTDERYALADVRLLAPLPDPPGNVICLGRNYAEHARESARAHGEEVTRPTFFSKAITSIIGPYDDIAFDSDLSTQIDWEAELAVIIGRRARHVGRNEALSYVFGYTVLNDISARDIQSGYGGQFFYGKSLDGSCPTGPCILTADEVPDPQSMEVRLWVDGVLKQEDSTRNMIFDVAESIATLSRGITLLPGQIIATGTPAGVGFARTPPEFLQPGNVVETEVEGIGRLRNVVTQVPST
jgi:2-keto-4-pentenoate hydratase/2-oxohepta-3-ene-1,7-dioic acid hydratase in catechol pathway